MSQPIWTKQAFAELTRFIDELPPALGARCTRVLSRLSGANGGSSLVSALSSPAATPGLALFEAYRSDLGLADTPRLAKLAHGMLSLYMHMRIQDDLVDEPALFDPAFVYLAEVFASASVTAFAQALDDPAAFFAFREQVLRRFAAAATWEVDRLHAGAAEADETWRIGEKLLPMAIPLGALAHFAGRPDEAARIPELTLPLATALQVINDLVNLLDDHAGRRPSPLLLRLYRSGALGPDSDATAARLALLAGDTIEQGCQWAATALEQAHGIARDLGRPELATAIRRHGAIIQRVPAMLTARCMQVAA